MYIPPRNYETDPYVQEFAWEAENAEPLSAGMAGAWVDFLKDKTHYAWYKETVDLRLRRQKPFSPGHARRLATYVCHSFLLEDDPNPTRYYTRPEWRDFIEEIHDDFDENIKFQVRHTTLDPVTSKPSRMYASILGSALYQPERDEYRKFDMGCSRNELLSGEDLFTFGSTETRKFMPGLPRLSK